MLNPRTLIPCALALLLLPMDGAGQAGAAPVPKASPVLDPLQGAWRTEDLDRTKTEWKSQVALNDQATLGAQFNLFRSERNAALAHGAGELDASARQRLGTLGTRLEIEAPGSYEAHMARYYLDFPSPGAFDALSKAENQFPGRMETLGPLLADAARRNDMRSMAERASALKRNGGTLPGFMRMADDILLSVEVDAVLFVAGEMDAYPLWIRQFADGQRKDVTVVDVRLLSDAGYRQQIWQQGGATGTVPKDPQRFLTAFVTASKRPVHLSLSLGKERLAPFQANTHPTGIALRYSSSPVTDMKLLEERWAKFNKPTDAGPLSQNYLLPASILLMHYRSIQDEGKAARMELELRRFATSIGASKALYTLGILEH